MGGVFGGYEGSSERDRTHPVLIDFIHEPLKLKRSIRIPGPRLEKVKDSFGCIDFEVLLQPDIEKSLLLWFSADVWVKKGYRVLMGFRYPSNSNPFQD